MTTDLLVEYSKEIYGYDETHDNLYFIPMTLEQLIDVHRRLRQMKVETNEYRLQARDEGFKIGVEQGMAQVNREWIKVEDLKKMTMAQIAEMLCDGDD